MIDYREIPLVSQGKRNHNICGVRLDCSSEVVHEYRLEQDRSFGHSSPLDPMAGFEKIMQGRT
jgi:hypothetical protein